MEVNISSNATTDTDFTITYPTQDSFECTCHTEELKAEWLTDDKSPSVELCFWQMGSWTTPLLRRLAHIWRIIRKGNPYADHILLDEITARRLAMFLMNPPRKSA